MLSSLQQDTQSGILSSPLSTLQLSFVLISKSTQGVHHQLTGVPLKQWKLLLACCILSMTTE